MQSQNHRESGMATIPKISWNPRRFSKEYKVSPRNWFYFKFFFQKMDSKKMLSLPSFKNRSRSFSTGLELGLWARSSQDEKEFQRQRKVIFQLIAPLK